MMTKDKIAEISMEIIMYAGVAKSLMVEALELAQESNYKGIDGLLKEAEQNLTEANKTHFKVLQHDAEGKITLDVLFIHAEDQFISTQMFFSTTTALIALHKKVDKVK